MGILNKDFNWGFNVEVFIRRLTWFGDFPWGLCMGKSNGGFNWGFYTGILLRVFMWGFFHGDFVMGNLNGV